jgi:hypothetical protein
MLLTLLQQHLNNPKMVLLLYDVMCRAAPYLFAHMGNLFVRYVGMHMTLLVPVVSYENYVQLSLFGTPWRISLSVHLVLIVQVSCWLET